MSGLHLLPDTKDRPPSIRRLHWMKCLFVDTNVYWLNWGSVREEKHSYKLNVIGWWTISVNLFCVSHGVSVIRHLLPEVSSSVILNKVYIYVFLCSSIALLRIWAVCCQQSPGFLNLARIWTPRSSKQRQDGAGHETNRNQKTTPDVWDPQL